MSSQKCQLLTGVNYDLISSEANILKWPDEILQA